jgi:hypothetical protein
MDIRKEWRRSPPMLGFEPEVLGDLFQYWRERRGDPASVMHIYRDQILDECRDVATFEESVVVACMSVRPNTGKMHHHQSKVPHLARFALARALVARSKGIQKAVRRGLDFHGYHEGVGKLARGIDGIGIMTIYDVSVRTGGWLGLSPDRVYLHAGCKLGAKRLGLSVRGREWLEVSEFPKPLSGMPADELEDFLCAHLAVFGKTYEELKEEGWPI